MRSVADASGSTRMRSDGAVATELRTDRSQHEPDARATDRLHWGAMRIHPFPGQTEFARFSQGFIVRISALVSTKSLRARATKATFDAFPRVSSTTSQSRLTRILNWGTIPGVASLLGYTADDISVPRP